MTAAVFDLASRGSYSVVTTHRADETAIIFGEPAELLSLDPKALQRVGYQGHLVGETPAPCAWREPCESSHYLVRGVDGVCLWLESRSVLGADGELIVNTRPAQVVSPSRLTASARLSMGGGYLGPIAHELNNIVQGVSSLAYLFRVCFDTGDAIDVEDLDQLSATAAVLTTLAAEIQNFARLGQDAAERLDLAALLERSIRLLKSVGRLKTLDLEIELPEDLPRVFWRRSELEFVFLALLGNAADAALAAQNSPQRLRVVVVALSDGVQVDISNSGANFDFPAGRAAFESTKQPHRHLGLGLPAVLAMLGDRGGSLRKLEHDDCCLRLRLPIVARGARA